MKKELTRLFSVLLAAVLVFGTLPVSAMGTDVADPPASSADDVAVDESVAEPEEQSAEEEAVTVQSSSNQDDTYQYNIFFLDCGRKYYSVDSIKTFIDEASEAGFNYIQLAVGNDGLRFLLNDMSLDVDGKTYDSEAVTSAIQAGNKAYNETITADKDHKAYNPATNELTQDQMDTIIAYANDKGMGVIPCVNSPGHMDAILSAATFLTGTNCAYNGSARTIDVTNNTAVEFTKALLQKYIDYFADKGCKLFNMGADEYANDIYTNGAMGFGNLQTSGKYSYYVNYVNQINAMVKAAGMTTMAFNDGVYFNNVTTSGTFDTDIIICYWSNGWSGYTPMPASKLASMGFQLVNTNGSYYWVLGKTDAQCSASKASGFEKTTFAGSEISNPVGSMFCIWADYPGDEEDADVISKTKETIAAFGKKLPDLKEKLTVPNGDSSQNMTEETITVVVGESKTITVPGQVTPGDVDDSNIASVSSEYQTETSTTVNETPVTSIESGKKYIIYNNKAGKVVSTSTVTKQYGGRYVTGQNFDSDSVENSSSVWCIDNVNGQNGTYTAKVYVDGTSTGLSLGAESANVQANPPTLNLSYNSTGMYWTISENSYYMNDLGETVVAGWAGGNGIDASTAYGSQLTIYEVENNTTGETKLTFTGNNEGETKVVIGSVTYTITVLPKALDDVEALTIEYWITNARVEDSDGNSEMELEAVDAYGEAGKSIAALVPASGMKDNQKMAFLKATRLTSDKKQTTGDGVDRTTSGDDFKFVRYWNNQWEISKDGDKWVSVASTDQIVAYYLQKTEVTVEVDTNVTDWGMIYKDWVANGRKTHWFWTNYVEKAGTQHNFVFMDFAVVYEDGTQNPSTFPTDNTMFFHADSIPRYVGYINFDENENYEIWKVTVTDGTCSGNSSASSFKSTYDGTEKAVWDTSMGGEPHIDQIEYTAKKTGKLIRVYVRTKKTEDSLTVNYIDDSTGETFYLYNIAVNEGTLFPDNFNFENNNKITNIKGVSQAVTDNLSQMSEIGAQYRYAAYERTSFDIADGNKTLNIHYNFTRDANFVIDFGTPLKISPSDINETLEKANITSVEVSGCNHGTATIGDDFQVIYTPAASFTSSEKGDGLLITYKGTKITESGAVDGQITYTVYIRPASNVLYEEGFLTEADGWTHDSEANSAPQSVQKAKATGVLGYDDTYKEMTGANGVWKADGLGSDKNITNPLTTEFYGNTFDLIGNCNSTTGRVILEISEKDRSEYGKIVDIDTRYTGDINQVPLAHVVLGETDKNYTVKVYAAPLAAQAATENNTMLATMGMDTAVEPDDVITQILEENGLSLDNVEYIRTSVEDTLNVAATAINLYSAKLADDGSGMNTSGREAGTHVEIDGFRVYRSTSDSVATSAYPVDEQNVTYKNILDAVGGYIVETAYTENGNISNCTVGEYQKAGGPQNEIYLDNGQSVTIQVSGTNTIQVSMRAVNTSTTWNTAHVINTNTEMYYTVDETEGAFIITNTGNGLLALGNVKIPAGATVTTANDMDSDVILASIRATYGNTSEPDPEPEPEPETFEPTTFDVSGNAVSVIRNKVVTLKIKVSNDVAYVTVNGVKYTRTGLQSAFQKTRTIRMINTIPRDAEKTYEIIAYNADGVASKTVTKTVK